VSGTIRCRRLGSAQMVSSNVSTPLGMATEQGQQQAKVSKEATFGTLGNIHGNIGKE
jgi:hypothetical protein